MFNVERNPSSFIRISLFAGMALIVPLVAGCLDHPVKPVEVDKSSVKGKVFDVQGLSDVDVLFVIDNSGSMAEEQRILSRNFGSFLSVLEQDDVNANYRIGITTTDMGNPRCDADKTSPEKGRLVLSSCRSRPDDFIGNDDFDASFACEDFCNEKVSGNITVLPTTIAEQEEAKPRKWIERTGGTSNISIPQEILDELDPPRTETTAAFQCFGPQGVSGCGFESQLESMYFAFARSEQASEEHFGFLRDTALLSVVFITDEADCSYNPDQGSFFINNKPLWADPDLPAPLSAACWFAGVTCSGGMDGDWDMCSSINLPVDHPEIYSQQSPLTEEEADDQAILHPVKRYKDKVNSIIAKKQADFMSDEVTFEALVALIGGVPEAYPSGSIPLKDLYKDSSDPNIMANFGIGPGCTNEQDNASAVPPVRLREFAEAFNPINSDNPNAKNIYSICAEDYSAALGAIANRIKEKLKPACFENCVADTNLSTEVVDPNCKLSDVTKDGTIIDIPECEINGEVADYPEGADACFVYRVDPAGNPPQTSELIDNMDPECVNLGSNLEFFINRRVSPAAGTRTQATCELSDLPERDCPNLAL